MGRNLQTTPSSSATVPNPRQFNESKHLQEQGIYSWLGGIDRTSRLHDLSSGLKGQVQDYLDNPSIPQARKDALLAKIVSLSSNMRSRTNLDDFSDWWMGTSKDTEAMNMLSTQIGDAISTSITDDYTEDYNSAESQVARLVASGQNPDLSGEVSPGESTGDSSEPLSSPFAGQSSEIMDSLSNIGSIAMSCFGNIVGCIQAVNSLNLADSQIGLMKSQSELASVQSSFVGSQIQSTEAQTSRTVHDLAYNIVHRTFDSSDFGKSLEDYGSSLNDDSWNQLSYADKVSKYLKYRAIEQASSFPKSIQKPLISQINSMLNPNAEDFKAWLSNTRANASEGNLRNEQNLLLLQEYGKGFGKLQLSMQRSQFEMNKQVFDYQNKLYKQYEQDGMISQESKAKIEELVARYKMSLVNSKIAELQNNKLQTLTDLSDWLSDKPAWMQGLGNWMLPTVSDGMESMIYNFGSSVGKFLGGFPNPMKSAQESLGRVLGALK